MENDIKRDRNGNIDTNYYLQEAHRLRSEYAAKLGKAMGAKVKGFFRGAHSRLSTHH